MARQLIRQVAKARVAAEVAIRRQAVLTAMNKENYMSNTESATLTREQVTLAFENWEVDFRESRADFMTPEETSEMEVCSLSESRALWLFAYARQKSPAK